MEKVKFGPSGNCQQFYDLGFKSSAQAPSWLKSIGLGAYEYSFGRGYLMSDETALEIGKQAKQNAITISVHAPYYINFANESMEMIEKSVAYIVRGLQYLKLMGGSHLVFHAASQGKLERQSALESVKERLIQLAQIVKQQGLIDGGVKLCPETMGKPLQIGTYREVVDLCCVDEIYVPTFDFGHIYALSLGTFGTYDDFKQVFEYSIEKLGFERTKNCHIHFSKIEFGKKGEVRHLDFSSQDFGPSYEPMLKAILDLGLTPTIICESRNNMAFDALEMKNAFDELLKNCCN